MSDAAIKIEGLRFSYGRKKVLKGVDLEVPAGSIFGFLGRNGTGKTTTIKTMLGMLKPSKGRCTVNGFDSMKGAMDVRRTIGYMAEDQQMYGWMKIGQLVKWVAGFYPGWDHSFTNNLLDMLELSRKAKVKTLSKGQNSRLALLLALGHRPKVVILDDPTLGLDPIARKDFLRHVIELLQSHGVTVFFSSHLLYEIEPVADHIAILDGGVIVKSCKTEQLREDVRRFVVSGNDSTGFEKLDGVLDLTGSAGNYALTVGNCDDSKRSLIRELCDCVIAENSLNLDEIFEAYVIGNRGKLTAQKL